MIIKHLQSSTQIIDLGGVKILTDPWLTEGEYLGSWFHYPPFNRSEIGDLEYDYIYVSHIHPDHCSEATMMELDKSKPVLIADFDAKFLKSKIEKFGFTVVELSHGRPFCLGDECSIELFLADNCDPELCALHFGCKAGVDQTGVPRSIDSLALFKSPHFSVLNTNDCPFDLAANVINRYDRLRGVDVLLVGYCGAGPYPQCFVMTEEDLNNEMSRKKVRFLNSAINYIDLVNPRYFAPFAGTYILGGKLADLNAARGVPNLREALDYIQDRIERRSEGILLEAGSELDVKDGKCTVRKAENECSLQDYIRNIRDLPYQYGDVPFDWHNDSHNSLLVKGWNRFRNKALSMGAQNTPTYIHLGDHYIRFSTDEEPIFVTSVVDQERIIIALDAKLFYLLLSGPRYAHWNNAEIGSHLTFDRGNLDFDRALNFAMNFFHA